jgi:N-acyl-L-homoserine lactone synthetase
MATEEAGAALKAKVGELADAQSRLAAAQSAHAVELSRLASESEEARRAAAAKEEQAAQVMAEEVSCTARRLLSWLLSWLLLL